MYISLQLYRQKIKINYVESQSNKAQTHDRNLKRIFWHWHWYDTSIRGWGIRQHWQKFDVSCVAWPQTIGSFIWVLDRRNAHRLIELTSNLGMHLIHVPILPPTYIICLWYRQPLYDKTIYAQFSARRQLNTRRSIVTIGDNSYLQVTKEYIIITTFYK